MIQKKKKTRKGATAVAGLPEKTSHSRQRQEKRETGSTKKMIKKWEREMMNDDVLISIKRENLTQKKTRC